MAAQTPVRPSATPAPGPSCARSANSVSLRVANVVQSLDGDARAVFGTVYPSTATQAATAAEAIQSLRDRPVIQTVRNAPVGSVLVALDRARLVKLATSHDAVIELVHAVRPPPEIRSPSAPRPHLTGGTAPSPPSCPLPCQGHTNPCLPRATGPSDSLAGPPRPKRRARSTASTTPPHHTCARHASTDAGQIRPCTNDRRSDRRTTRGARSSAVQLSLLRAWRRLPRRRVPLARRCGLPFTAHTDHPIRRGPS